MPSPDDGLLPHAQGDLQGKGRYGAPGRLSWVKPPTLDFSPGHDLAVHEFELHVGLVLTGWKLLGILSFSLSLPCLLLRAYAYALSLSLSLSLSLCLSK